MSDHHNSDAETVDGYDADDLRTGFDYVDDVEPSNPTEGEEWYDPSANAAYVYDGAAWLEETVSDHGKLSGVSPGQHFDAGNALAFGGGALSVEEGNISLSNLSGYPVDAVDLSFDPATQTELDNHAGDANAHHSPPSGVSSTSTSAGRQTGCSLTAIQDADANGAFHLRGHFEEIKLFNSNNSTADVTLHYADGTASGGSVGTDESVWIDLDPSRFLVGVVLTEYAGPELRGVHPAAQPHSHSFSY